MSDVNELPAYLVLAVTIVAAIWFTRLLLEYYRFSSTVMVVDDADRTSSFVVREVRTYDQDDRPEEVFESSKGTHLNLITCAGAWNATTQRFPDRLVVFAEKNTQ